MQNLKQKTARVLGNQERPVSLERTVKKRRAEAETGGRGKCQRVGCWRGVPLTGGLLWQAESSVCAGGSRVRPQCVFVKPLSLDLAIRETH